uniref:glycerol-1-phosphatase n=1 Tax=Solanum lycopersicum TaxID=4081 RepID=A0A3Q7IHY6_SOLLC
MANQGIDTSSARKGSITHVIFDMDGLLLGSVKIGWGLQTATEIDYATPHSSGEAMISVFLNHVDTGSERLGIDPWTDTEKFYTEVQEIILARYNKTFDWSLKAKMMGKKAIEAARVFVEETGISDSLTAEDFLVEREEMLQKMFPTSDLMPGASRLIHHLHENGIPICVATGTHTRHFDLKTQRHSELFSLMHHIVRGDDPEVKQGKPSPDIFLAAANRFEGGTVDPQRILVFEDAPSGVLAAKNAGIFMSQQFGTK